jgi:hypothetical protein
MGAHSDRRFWDLPEFRDLLAVVGVHHSPKGVGNRTTLVIAGRLELALGWENLSLLNPMGVSSFP